MKRVCIFITALLGILPAGKPEDVSLDTLEGLVKTWTELRLEIAAEEREWTSARNVLGLEIALLKDEISALEKEIAAFEAFSEELEEKNRNQLQQKREFSSYLEGLKPLLERMEQDLAARKARLPEPFQDQVQIPEKMRVVDRVQTVAAALTALEEIQSGLHRTREMLPDGEGGKREMEVVYLGLARAFAVSVSDDWAGIGLPGKQGWEWSARPELAPKVRKLLDILSDKQPGELVELPVEIVDMQGEGS